MVMLVLAGTPVAASACALWCPAGATHARTATDRSASVDPIAAARACAATHGHEGPAGPVDGATHTADAASPSEPADAATAALTHPAASVAAASACCDVPIVETVRVAASVEALVSHAPPLQPVRVEARDRSEPPRVAFADASPPAAVARAMRALVLRI